MGPRIANRRFFRPANGVVSRKSGRFRLLSAQSELNLNASPLKAPPKRRNRGVLGNRLDRSYGNPGNCRNLLFFVFLMVYGDVADVVSDLGIPIKPIKASHSRGNALSGYSAERDVSARLRALKPSSGENRRVHKPQAAKGRWPKAIDPPAFAAAARASIYSLASGRLGSRWCPTGFSEIVYKNLPRYGLKEIS